LELEENYSSLLQRFNRLNKLVEDNMFLGHGIVDKKVDKFLFLSHGIVDKAFDFLNIVNYLQHPPKESCKDIMNKLAQQDDYNKFGIVLKNCERLLDHKITNLQTNPQELSDDEMLAIVVYTYDLRTYGKKDENFYYKLNKILQKRSTKLTENNVELWSGYLYYLQKALSKIENTKITVYRGIPKEKKIIFKDNYTIKREIIWSGYTSTTDNKNIAAKFAGEGGIVIEIDVETGKKIKDYSFYASENEVLLSPNMSFIVEKELTDDNEVKLKQYLKEKTFVF